MDGELLSDTFVELTDTMVAGFDVIDFLHVLTDRSVQLLDVSAAGLLLADPRGELRVVAASSEAARLLELFQLQNDQGPCLDCFRAAQPVAAPDLAAAASRWPRFAPATRHAGFAAVQALPMRLREQVIGALNLFRADPGALAPADIRVGQALADVATISLLHERSMRHSDTLNEQLQTALNSRVIPTRTRTAVMGGRTVVSVATRTAPGRSLCPSVHCVATVAGRANRVRIGRARPRAVAGSVEDRHSRDRTCWRADTPYREAAGRPWPRRWAGWPRWPSRRGPAR